MTDLAQLLKIRLDAEILSDTDTLIARKNNVILIFNDVRTNENFYRDLILTAENENFINFFLLLTKDSLFIFHIPDFSKFDSFDIFSKEDMNYLGSFNWSSVKLNSNEYIFTYVYNNMEFEFKVTDENKLKKIKIFENILRKYDYERNIF